MKNVAYMYDGAEEPRNKNNKLEHSIFKLEIFISKLEIFALNLEIASFKLEVFTFLLVLDGIFHSHL